MDIQGGGGGGGGGGMGESVWRLLAIYFGTLGVGKKNSNIYSWWLDSWTIFFFFFSPFPLVFFFFYVSKLS